MDNANAQVDLSPHQTTDANNVTPDLLSKTTNAFAQPDINNQETLVYNVHHQKLLLTVNVHAQLDKSVLQTDANHVVKDLLFKIINVSVLQEHNNSNKHAYNVNHQWYSTHKVNAFVNQVMFKHQMVAYNVHHQKLLLMDNANAQLAQSQQQMVVNNVMQVSLSQTTNVFAHKVKFKQETLAKLTAHNTQLQPLMVNAQQVNNYKISQNAVAPVNTIQMVQFV